MFDWQNDAHDNDADLVTGVVQRAAVLARQVLREPNAVWFAPATWLTDCLPNQRASQIHEQQHNIEQQGIKLEMIVAPIRFNEHWSYLVIDEEKDVTIFDSYGKTDAERELLLGREVNCTIAERLGFGMTFTADYVQLVPGGGCQCISYLGLHLEEMLNSMGGQQQST